MCEGVFHHNTCRIFVHMPGTLLFRENNKIVTRNFLAQLIHQFMHRSNVIRLGLIADPILESTRPQHHIDNIVPHLLQFAPVIPRPAWLVTLVPVEKMIHESPQPDRHLAVFRGHWSPWLTGSESGLEVVMDVVCRKHLEHEKQVEYLRV